MLRKALILFWTLVGAMTISAGSKGDNWVLENHMETTVRSFYTVFYNGETGFSGGHLHELIRSDDGGDTWNIIYPESEHGIRFDMEFIDENSFFSANTGGLDYTEDGGSTWHRIIDQQFDYISFVDRQVGWCQEKQQWFRTQDGGITWDYIEIPASFGQVYGLSVFSYDEALVWTNDGLLISTTDGGEYWSTQDIGAVIRSEGFRPRFSTSAIRFNGPNHGILFVMDRSQPYQWIICETLDGGNSWKFSTIQQEGSGRPEISVDMNHITLMEPTEVDPDIYLFKREL